MKNATLAQKRVTGEVGFTLVEALVAIVILIFGLIAVTNLLLVAASSNSAANHGTAATAIASERLERFRAVTYTALVPGSSGNEDAVVPGVGTIHTQWEIVGMGDTARFIRVRSESTSPILAARSRAELTTIRSFTEPTPTPTGTPTPTPAP